MTRMKSHCCLSVAVIWTALCTALPAADPAPADTKVTFNKHIAPLVFERCASCHHPGEVAPFSLLNYADLKKRAQQIAQVTADRFMPPWKSVEGHGHFIGERRLTKEQIAQSRARRKICH
jgi:mono/diheme cytochrome c family protein